MIAISQQICNKSHIISENPQNNDINLAVQNVSDRKYSVLELYVPTDENIKRKFCKKRCLDDKVLMQYRQLRFQVNYKIKLTYVFYLRYVQNTISVDSESVQDRG